MATFANKIEYERLVLQTSVLWAFLSNFSDDIISDLENDHETQKLVACSKYKDIKTVFAEEVEDEDDNCVELFKVAQAENPDIEYFKTLNDAKNYVDKYRDSHQLDYGHIMRVEKDGKEEEEAGFWGEFYEA